MQRPRFFGENAFRKPLGENNRRRPVNRALFEAWSVQLVRCSPEQIDILVERREDVQCRFMQLMTEDDDFDRAVSSGTGAPRHVRIRFQAIQQLVEELV